MVTLGSRRYPDVPNLMEPVGEPNTRPPPTQPSWSRPRTTQPPQLYNYDDNREITTTTQTISYPFNSSDMFPLQSLSQVVSDTSSSNYEYLKIEWTESNEKWEYITRFSPSRNGFWLSSAPQRNNLPLIC